MRHKLSNHKPLTAALLLTAFSGLLLSLFFFRQEDFRFEHFVNTALLQELSANPVSFHFTIRDADAFHVDEASLQLPIYQPNQALTTGSIEDSMQLRLASFHPEKLSTQNQYLHTLLTRYLENAASVSAYPYFEEPLSPSSGITAELPLLLAEYRITDTGDLQNYFSLLEQLPDYLDGILLYEQEKARAGMFMAETSADKVIRQCGELMSEDALLDDSHFLNATFVNRIDALELTPYERESYLSQHDRLLTTVVAPAYERLADGLTLLKESGRLPSGLAAYPGGRDYYAALMRQLTGSYRSPEEIKTLLYDDMTEKYHALLALLREYPQLQELLQSENSLLPDMTPDTMLLYLKTQMTETFPHLADASSVSCTVKYVNPSLEPYTAPAFYMLPCIDQLTDNTIYINQKGTSDRLSLFTTLAHEGYPGHLYQTVYCYQYWEQQKLTPLRGILYYGGFTEGWALYVELLSYDYAAALSDSGQPDAALYYQASRLDRQFQLGLYSLLDIAIHYDNASLTEVENIFASLGIANPEGIREVYTYICEEPAGYLKYYLGYLEITELKKQAADTWYTDTPASEVWSDPAFLYRFHSFLLQNGPADFALLSSIMESR